MATGVRTTVATATGTGTYTLSNIQTVAQAIREDLDELVDKCKVDLVASMGASNSGRYSKERLLTMLENDLYRLLYKGLVDEIAFVFHEPDKYANGYIMNYRASYKVQPGQRQGSATGRIPHSDLMKALGNNEGVFKIIVVWSGTFFSLSNGERQAIMGGEDRWNFQWVAADPLLDEWLDSGQVTAHYYSGNYGVARVERVRIR